MQVSKEQFEKILEMISIGKEQGAKLETGGGRIGEKGYYIQPTVFSNVEGQDAIFVGKQCLKPDLKQQCLF